MPYTPPTHRSPASTTTSSPDVSRRPSFQAGGPRPSLPRSASYLTKHRRTPSAVGGSSNGNINQPSPEATSDDLKSLATSASVRASPPPVTDAREIPNGAIISPPDSSSDDDELPEVRGRRIENLKELQAAISQIPVHRESSPTKASQGDLAVLSSQAEALAEGIRTSFSTGSLDGLVGGGRRVSHARSITEPNASGAKSAEGSATPSEEESEEDAFRKPQMVRKKSGELVRPALRPPSRRRPSSMPGTPTFSKAVHFDSHLEHVRHFLQVDRPLAVSAGSSPADNYDSDNEYPFPSENGAAVRSPPYEWEIIMSNFPIDTPSRKAQPIRLERVWLSSDQKCLIGSVIVANLAFHKVVTCRFTLDYWKTTSEISAEYIAEVTPRQADVSRDRFNFTIKLSDLANLESKTLYFCIRYSVNGAEYWDNNGGPNFQVDFRKKMMPQNGKKGAIGASTRPANALPRSSRRMSPAGTARPMSMPVGSDEFDAATRINFDQSIHDYLGENGPSSLRLKGIKSSSNLPSDNLTARLSSPSGQAFANRYDFGASLTAAMQAAKDSMSSRSEGLYMKQRQKPAQPTANTSKTLVKDHSSANQASANQASAAANRALPLVPGTGSPNASISSSSYEELVNKYCFFGSKQSSPQFKDGTLKGGRFDGANDAYVTRGTNSTNSSTDGSPITMGTHHAQSAQHHSFNHPAANSYFDHPPPAGRGASPSESPLQNSATDRANGQPPRTSVAAGQSPVRTASPTSLGSLPPFAGTSPIDFAYRHVQDRFPFGTDAHAATAIKG